MVRNCRQDTELVGEPVEAGTKVLMCIGSGNHDDVEVRGPRRVPPGSRVTREHLSFGSGPHICPGATLARLEVRTLMREFTKRIASFRIVDEHYDSLPLGMLQGQKSLRIVR